VVSLKLNDRLLGGAGWGCFGRARQEGGGGGEGPAAACMTSRTYGAQGIVGFLNNAEQFVLVHYSNGLT
jgi:hypothetical protein